MYSIEFLNKNNIYVMDKLNNNRLNFNNLNLDFFEEYNVQNFARQLFLRKQVKLLKYGDEYIGYIWYETQNKKQYVINSLMVEEGYENIEAYRYLMDIMRKSVEIIYTVERNSYNYLILNSIGFVIEESTCEMALNLKDYNVWNEFSTVTFETFKKGEHEEVRCSIQNEVFKNKKRIPLTRDDIAFDETQSYYYEPGAVFIKLEEAYIGYGQIIVEDKFAIIVNVGVLNEYRGQGYSKQLMHYLLNLLKQEGFTNVIIRVSARNQVALSLYRSLGFEYVNEVLDLVRNPVKKVKR